MTDKNSENDKAESNPPWYGNDRFMRFWHYYNTLMKTAHKDAIIRAHFASVRRRNHLTSLLLQMRGAPADDIKRPSMFTSSLRKSSVDSSRSNRNKKKRRRKKRNRRLREQARLNKQEGMSDTEVLYSQMSKGMHINDPEDEEEDMDVNEDFLQFLEHSHKHRNEWKVRKTNLLASTSGILGPPLTLGCISREHPDVIRSREMKHLYGSASSRIHAMETAIQLSFDRISTCHHPQFWPNIPLQVEF